MSAHFLHLWTLCQNNAPHNFERRSSFKNIKQNVKDSVFWVSCISGIRKKSASMFRMKLYMLSISNLLDLIISTALGITSVQVSLVIMTGCHCHTVDGKCRLMDHITTRSNKFLTMLYRRYIITRVKHFGSWFIRTCTINLVHSQKSKSIQHAFCRANEILGSLGSNKTPLCS